MFRLIVLFSILVSTSSFSSEVVDASGEFQCECLGNYCDESENFLLKYDRDSLRIDIIGGTWEYSGYVTRQFNKTVNRVYLTLPASYSIATPKTLILSGNGSVEVNGRDLTCSKL